MTMDPEAQEIYPATNSGDNNVIQGVLVPTKETKCWPQKRRLLYIAAAILLVSLIAIIGITVGSGKATNGSQISSSPLVECNEGEENVDGEPDFRRLQAREFEWVGCFKRQTSVDTLRLNQDATLKEQAQACSDHCFTRHFGVVDSRCLCFVGSPEERLSIGSCESVCSVPASERMNTYFKMASNDNCNQETTSAVRNFLVEEDDTPFGFDIMTNQFRSSPFQLYKDECGTNIYEVQTEISEGSNELSTSSQLVSEFATERRSHLSSSISTSAEGGRKGLFVKASVKASASLDKEQNSILQSSGANSAGAKVFTSLGVKRLAEVKIADFSNKNHFVTLSPQFGAAIRKYKTSGFSKDMAREIFKEYGMFVMERGIFGGFMQLRTTATEKSLEELFASEEDSRRCFEAAVSGKASAFGFSGSFSVEGGACTEEQASAMRNMQSNFAQEASEQTVTGGKLENGELVVTPEFSTLLTSKDKYPPGDDGIELRVLSDFLHPEKISPLEVKRLLLTELDFLEIKENLETHILEELQAVGARLEQCGSCALPYLEDASIGSQCVCYNPAKDDKCKVTLQHKEGGWGSDVRWSVNNMFAFHNGATTSITAAESGRLIGSHTGGSTLQFLVPDTVDTIAFASQDAKAFDLTVTGCRNGRRGPGYMKSVHWSNAQYRDGGAWTAEDNRNEKHWSYNVVRISDSPKVEFLPWSALPF